MRKFLIGCGVLLGALLLIGLVSSWILLRQLKNELPQLDQMEDRQEELRARFGPVDEFVPPLDGRVDPQRMEVYLGVRAALPVDDTRFLEALGAVSDQEERLKQTKGVGKLREMYRMAREGMGVARVAMEYLSLRDSVLLEEDMGAGEYLYYTTLGPILALDYHPERCGPELGERIGSEDAERLEDSHLHLLSTFRDQLANARRALRALESRTEDEDAYLAALDREFEHGRIGEHPRPFGDGLPEMTRASLAPYLDRIRDHLPRCRETWALELIVAADENDRGIQVKLNSGDDE